MLNFIIGLVIGVGIGWVIWKRPFATTPSQSPPIAFGAGGENQNPNAEKIEEKQKNLEKVLEMAREKSEICNDDVEHVLRVSNATAERYLQELESQGILEQIGPTGQAVRYRLKQPTT